MSLTLSRLLFAFLGVMFLHFIFEFKIIKYVFLQSAQHKQHRARAYTAALGSSSLQLSGVRSLMWAFYMQQDLSSALQRQTRTTMQFNGLRYKNNNGSTIFLNHTQLKPTSFHGTVL